MNDPQNKVKHIYSSLLSHSNLAPPAIGVKEVWLEDESGAAPACLIVGVANHPTTFSVKDEAGKLS